MIGRYTCLPLAVLIPEESYKDSSRDISKYGIRRNGEGFIVLQRRELISLKVCKIKLGDGSADKKNHT